jgi:hypothetical protein
LKNTTSSLNIPMMMKNKLLELTNIRNFEDDKNIWKYDKLGLTASFLKQRQTVTSVHALHAISVKPTESLCEIG